MDAALSHRGVLVTAAFAAYASIAAAYIAFEVPGLGIGHLFYLPIALVALATGALLGAGAGVVATALFVACVIVNHRIPSTDVLTASTVIRGATYVSSGALIGSFASRNRALVERLRELADRDFLTGLLNARSFEAALDRRCLGPRRFAVLLADVDGLKATNDRDGHAAGNALLRTAAVALSGMLRENEELARIGGDEFALLAEISAPEDAAAAAQRIETELAGRGVRLSVGWAVFPADGSTSISLYRRADERLYTSKSARRAREEVASLLRTVG